MNPEWKLITRSRARPYFRAAVYVTDTWGIRLRGLFFWINKVYRDDISGIKWLVMYFWYIKKLCFKQFLLYPKCFHNLQFLPQILSKQTTLKRFTSGKQLFNVTFLSWHKLPVTIFKQFHLLQIWHGYSSRLMGKHPCKV